MTGYEALFGTLLSREYSLFICHAWNYGGDYEGVVSLLNSDASFVWRNLSVQKDKPLRSLFPLPKSYRHLCRQLDELISKADCVLVPGAMYVAHRQWIHSELEAAQDFRKPIVAIAPRGQERIPEAVRYTAHAIVGWNSASIINAIRDLVTDSRAAPPDGGLLGIIGPDVPPLRGSGGAIGRLVLGSIGPDGPPLKGSCGLSSLTDAIARSSSDERVGRVPHPPVLATIFRPKK